MQLSVIRVKGNIYFKIENSELQLYAFITLVALLDQKILESNSFFAIFILKADFLFSLFFFLIFSH